ncbi:MAG: hypothetical protein Q7R76_04480 [Candidatus Woesearchaeota archaeon]|nr:hypothetical protein [Candidatus Woesearchaeota archaeon]
MHPIFTSITILPSKQVKEIHEHLLRQWGCSFDDKKKYGYLLSRKEKIYLINRNVTSTLDLDILISLRIDRMGMYFGEQVPGGLRLSIEGSQLVGPHATKNVLTISDTEKSLWLKGEPLEKHVDEQGFVIIACPAGDRTDFLGCGRVHADHEKVANFIPKTRTLLSSNE